MVASVIVPVLMLLQSTSAVSADTLIASVQQVSSADTNDARFAALAALLRARNLTFTIDSFTLERPVGADSRTEGRNVIVTLGGSGHELVIGAHYDAARLSDGTLSRGAVDNAASTVLLVYLAEALRAEKLRYRLRIVWFDMEELGLLGSARYVSTHKADRTVAMLNFDVNGYGDTILFGPSENERNTSLRRALAQTCVKEARNCVGFPQMPPGDDRSFTDANVPSLSIATLPAAETYQLWLLLNATQGSGLAPGYVPPIVRTIHSAGDTVAKLDGQSMSRTLQFALALVRNVASR